MSQLACEFTGVNGEKVALKEVSISSVLRDLLAEVTVSQKLPKPGAEEH